jgi:hypothetical protein
MCRQSIGAPFRSPLSALVDTFLARLNTPFPHIYASLKFHSEKHYLRLPKVVVFTALFPSKTK